MRRGGSKRFHECAHDILYGRHLSGALALSKSEGFNTFFVEWLQQAKGEQIHQAFAATEVIIHCGDVRFHCPCHIADRDQIETFLYDQSLSRIQQFLLRSALRHFQNSHGTEPSVPALIVNPRPYLIASMMLVADRLKFNIYKIYLVITQDILHLFSTLYSRPLQISDFQIFRFACPISPLATWRLRSSIPRMLHKIIIPAIVLSASAFAADITEIPFKTASGEKTNLAAYEGKAVLLVNVASKCGFTKQYAGLEKLYEEKKDDGLVILAFPCNDFGGQEPGTIEEIEKFCKSTYDVKFPIMEKIHVKGDDQHPLYEELTGKRGAFPGDVKWNFGKILISKKGKPLARFESATTPDSPELTKAIADALTE